MKYEGSKEPLERVHVDFPSPINNRVYFILMDSYLKWPASYFMNNITTEELYAK